MTLPQMYMYVLLIANYCFRCCCCCLITMHLVVDFSAPTDDTYSLQVKWKGRLKDENVGLSLR